MNDDPSISLKCFIFGYFGWNNFGDDSIGLAILEGLSSKFLPTDLAITSREDYFLSENCVSNVKNINFNFFDICRAIKNSDIFVIAGGTHFQDDDPKKIRRIIVYSFFSIIILFAKLFKSQIIIFGHGIGPIKYNWSRLFVNFILKNAKFIIVRDKDSFKFIKSLKLENKSFRGFDLAIGLKEDCLDISETNILGVSLLPFYEIYFNNSQKDDYLLNEVYQSLKRVQYENKELKIKLFAFRSGNRHSDEEILKKLEKKLLRNSDKVSTVIYEGNAAKFISELCECSSFLGMRYHSILFSYILNKPFVAIDYMGKCKSLIKDVKIPSKAVISLEDIDSSKLNNKINEMLSNPENYRARYSIDNFERLNKKSYDEFFKLLKEIQ